MGRKIAIWKDITLRPTSGTKKRLKLERTCAVYLGQVAT